MRSTLLILAALPLLAADNISGKWKIEGDVVGNPVNLSCSIQQQEQAKITGKCLINEQETVEIAGTAKEGAIAFSFTSQSGYTLQYTGKVDGGTMKGEIAVSGASGTFTGKQETK